MKPSPTDPYLVRLAYIERTHTLGTAIERTPFNPPPYDKEAYQKLIYAHRKQIAILRDASPQDHCFVCKEPKVIRCQVADFDPRNDEPRGILCRVCRHVARYQVWENGVMVYALDSAGAKDMALRLELVCELTHANDMLGECPCRVHARRWHGLAVYLAAYEDRSSRYVEPVQRKKKGAGTEVPTPVFLAP